MLDKLVIGTANFGQKYNGIYVSPKEQNKIWAYCREVGIDMVDTAIVYGKIYIPKGFKVVTKIIDDSLVRGYYGCLVHHIKDFDRLWPRLRMLKKRGFVKKIGISIYPEDKRAPFDGIDIIQLPYKRLKHILPELRERDIEIHVRKVFADDCFEEAVKDPNADRVVIGIDNLKQLKENVRRMAKY